jgi:hypothetical protein
MRATRRPAWAALYAIVCLTILMLFSVNLGLPTDGPERAVADVFVVLFGFVLVWIWLRGNRAALARSPRTAERS